MKIVINRCFGGFGLSFSAMARIAELKGWRIMPSEDYLWNVAIRSPEGDILWWYNVPRNDPALVQAVEELGALANGEHADLRVVEIPDDVQWEIDEYDGIEHIAEQHRVWYGED